MNALTGFDFALENAAAQAKRGLMCDFAVFSVFFALLWFWLGTGAVYLLLFLLSIVLYDIADSCKEFEKSGFDFDYGIKTN